LLAPPDAALPTQVNHCDNQHACDHNCRANFLLSQLIHAQQLDVPNSIGQVMDRKNVQARSAIPLRSLSHATCIGVFAQSLAPEVANPRRADTPTQIGLESVW
jgi:hypothetical protein